MQSEIEERVIALAFDWGGLELLRDLATGQEPDVEVLADYGLDDDADFLEALDYVALELVTNKRNDVVFELVLVTGTGGPHHEYRIAPSGLATSEAVWGSHRAVRYRGGFAAVFDYLEEVL